MKSCLLRTAAALLLLTGLGAPLHAGGGTEEHAAVPPGPLPDTGPFARAPHDVKLVITEPARLVSPGAEFVDGLAAADPGRFRKDGEHWVDSTGEFTWDKDEEIYWQTVSASVLTRGRQDFVQFCSSCHGLDGDGYGRSAQHLRPPPRNFTQSTFKFTKVPSDKLPADSALIKLVRHGLNGTPMYPWAVSESRLHDIVQYIKSLSTEGSGWRDATSEIGQMVPVTPDPWAGKEADAVEAGKIAYHKNQCYSCHPGYVTPAELNKIRGVDANTTYAADLTYPKLKKDSSYTVLGYKVAILPPDFTWESLRYSGTPTEAYQTIAAGIGGAGMPTWAGAMPEKDLWAIAHYVRYLVDTYKDKPGRDAFMAGLRKAP